MAPDVARIAMRSDETRDLAQRIFTELDELHDETVKQLINDALMAERTVWATVTCKHCARDGKCEVAVPDSGVKVKALEILLRAKEKPTESGLCELARGLCELVRSGFVSRVAITAAV